RRHGPPAGPAGRRAAGAAGDGAGVLARGFALREPVEAVGVLRRLGCAASTGPSGSSRPTW
ncbi:hypothetical protein, partial [Catellatospora chokoriensis]|uniref:hypothetical protein n=1 Tax=Catellatospora chokoriensis TaxID=310353 RepID=UPI0031D1A5D9